MPFQRGQSPSDLSGQNLSLNANVSTRDVGTSGRSGVFRCTCCGQSFATQRGNFITSFSPLYRDNNGYLPFCKTCVNEFYTKLLDFYGNNEQHAIEHCCRVFDWYYDPDITAAVPRNTKGYTDVTLYASKMGLAQFKNRGSTYLDTVRNNANPSLIMPEDNLKPEYVTPEEAEAGDFATVPKEAVDFFGYGFSPLEYDVLQREYDDWRARYECNTKAQEELFKSLCVNSVYLRRAQIKGDVKAINELMKQQQDLMGSANLKPNQNNDNAFADQNTFGSLIALWEKNDPIPEPLPEWKDVDGIQKYVTTWYHGHLCKGLHIQNDCSQQYEDELAKYTVNPPSYDDSEEQIDTSIFDKYSTKGGDNNGDTEGIESETDAESSQTE